jgi:hypothetical protein
LLDRLERRALLSLTIQLDYSKDANNFFDTQAKKDLLQLAVNSIANEINTSLAAIPAPTGSNSWTATFFDPATGSEDSIPNLVVPADTIIVFVGGRAFSGAERGNAGPGGFSTGEDTQDFVNLIQGRGQAGALVSPPTAFSPWGGSITFDTTANWFFGATTTGLTSSQTDFLSVATHEMGHVLGIGDNISGQVTTWSRFVSNDTFVGPHAAAANGGQPVPLDPGGNHWAEGTTSGGQEAAMTPVLLDGTRKLFTPLDFAGLADIGWNVAATSPVQFSLSNYSVSEQAGSIQITVTRPAGGATGTVKYATSDGTARAGVDYTASSGTLTFPAGATTATFTVPIHDDQVQGEADESFHVNLSQFNVVGAGTPTSASVIIVEDGHPKAVTGDFDGDGKADPAVFEPSTATFYIAGSSVGNEAVQFGIGTLFGGSPENVSADYEGRGFIDPAVFEPSTSTFYIHTSQGNQAVQFGIGTLFGGHPVPVPGDYQGDGIIDPAVFEPSTATFYIARHGAPNEAIQFGQGTLFGGHPVPIPNDYEGDGQTDPGVFEPSTSTFFLARHAAPNEAIQFGQGTNFGGQPVVVPGNYEGDGKIDPAVFEPSTSTFYIARHSAPNEAVQFGQGTLFGGHPIVVPGDYEGDGQADPAVYEPSMSIFFIARHKAPNEAVQFGIGTQFGGHPIAVPAAFEGGGQLDPAVFEPSTSTFYIARHNAQNEAVQFGQGTIFGGHPVPISAPESPSYAAGASAQALGVIVGLSPRPSQVGPKFRLIVGTDPL